MTAAPIRGACILVGAAAHDNTRLMLWVLLAIVWVMVWVIAMVDIVRRHDLLWWAKVLWALTILVIPVVGLAVYYIVRPKDPHGSPHMPESADLNDERLRGTHPF